MTWPGNICAWWFVTFCVTGKVAKGEGGMEFGMRRMEISDLDGTRFDKMGYGTWGQKGRN